MGLDGHFRFFWPEKRKLCYICVKIAKNGPPGESILAKMAKILASPGEL